MTCLTWTDRKPNASYENDCLGFILPMIYFTSHRSEFFLDNQKSRLSFCQVSVIPTRKKCSIFGIPVSKVWIVSACTREEVLNYALGGSEKISHWQFL